MSGKAGLHVVAIAFLLCCTSTTQAQKSDSVAPAPVPSQILSAKKIFISNGGSDQASLEAFKREMQVEKPYNAFYSEMAKWGRYELVSAPADADLVFEISFAAPISSCDKVTSRSPEMTLLVLDTKTHFTLWTFREPVEGALRKATWERNFDQGMAKLIGSVQELTLSPVKVESRPPAH